MSKPHFRVVPAHAVKVGMWAYAPAVKKAYCVHKISVLFDGTIHISLDETNNRHLRRKPDQQVWIAV